MTKRHFIIILFFSLLTSERLYSSGYKINIQISGFRDDTIFMADYYGNKSFVKDTVILNSDGTGSFEGKNNLSPGIYAIVLPKKQFFDILINKEQNFKITSDTSDIFGKLKFDGSDESDWYWQFQSHLMKNHNKPDYFIKDLITKHPNSLFARYAVLSLSPEYSFNSDSSSIVQKFKEQYTYLTDHYFDNINLSDSLLLKTPAFYEKINYFFNSLLSQQADTIINKIKKIMTGIDVKSPVYKYLVSYLINNYQQNQHTKLENVYVFIADNFYLDGKAPWTSETYIKLLKTRIDQLKTSLIGSKAPNLMLETQGRRSSAIYDIRAEHVLLIFYDIDCSICCNQINELKEIYEGQKILGLKIVAIYIHTDFASWDEFIKDNKLHWINLFDPSISSDYRRLYNIQKVPELFLLDKNKIIVDKYFTASQLEEIMKQKR